VLSHLTALLLPPLHRLTSFPRRSFNDCGGTVFALDTGRLRPPAGRRAATHPRPPTYTDRRPAPGDPHAQASTLGVADPADASRRPGAAYHTDAPGAPDAVLPLRAL